MKVSKKYIILVLIMLISGFNIIYGSEISQKKDIIKVHFNTNKNGQTYGTHISDDNGLTIAEPDLIEVIGENNVEGYVKKIDLYDESFNPKTPEEFVRYVEEREKNGQRIIPVYKKDGKSIIGEYKID